MPDLDVMVTIAEGDISRVVDAYADRENYDVNKLPGETRPQFAARMLGEDIVSFVMSHERRVRQSAAEASPIPEPVVTVSY